MFKAILYALTAVAYAVLYVGYGQKPVGQLLAEPPQFPSVLISTLFVAPPMVLIFLAVYACQRAMTPRQDRALAWERSPFQSLWAGQIPMWNAFWGWHIPNTVLFALIGSYAIPSFLGHADKRVLAVLLIFLVACPAYHALTILGTWRSSRRYAGQRTGVLLARTGLVLSTVGTATALTLAFERAIRTS